MSYKRFLGVEIIISDENLINKTIPILPPPPMSCLCFFDYPPRVSQSAKSPKVPLFRAFSHSFGLTIHENAHKPGNCCLQTLTHGVCSLYSKFLSKRKSVKEIFKNLPTKCIKMSFIVPKSTFQISWVFQKAKNTFGSL